MAGKDQTTTIIVVVVIMMVTVIALGSGWYILQKDDDDDGGGGGSNQANQEGGGGSGSNQGNDGEPTNPCILDTENSYLPGFCLNTGGVPLTGETGSCGLGKKLMSPNVVQLATGGGYCPEPYQVDCEVECPCVLDADTPYFISACETEDGVELTGGIDSCGVGRKLKTPNGTGSCPPATYEMCTVGCPCVLEEGNEYTYGQCLDKVTSVPLTGEKNSCGPGQKSKDPNVKTASSGGGFCPQSTFVDCDKACVKLCEAPDEYWRPVEGASCMSGTKKLGERTDLGDGTMGTFHGIGTQMKYLDGTGLTDSEKDVMNFDACIAQGPTLKSCRVMQTADSRAVPCPIPNYDAGWSYQGGGQGTVYTKLSAEALFNGELERGVLDLVPMTPVSRHDAINTYLAFSTSTGEVIDANLPKGYKIAFKASNELDTEYLRENGCSIFKFEEASAPRTREDATWEEVAGDCDDVACGQYQKRDIDHNILLPAWGGGSNTKPDTERRDCTTTTLPCCMKGTSHYTESVCDKATGKITFTHKGSACEPGNGGPSSYEESCLVDCEQTDWETTGDCIKKGTAYKQEQTRQTTVTAKHGGNACLPESQDIDCCHTEEPVLGRCTPYWWRDRNEFTYELSDQRINSCNSGGIESVGRGGETFMVNGTAYSANTSGCGDYVNGKCWDGSAPMTGETCHGSPLEYINGYNNPPVRTKCGTIYLCPRLN